MTKLRALLASLLLLPSLVMAQTTYIGDFDPGTTIYFPLNTYNSSGASVTLTGLATTDLEVYKNGSVAQRASDAGYALLDTDGIDFDATTGLHGFSIDTNDNTDAGFYTSPGQYWVNVNAVTVDSQTVNLTYYFTLGMNLRATTGGRELDVSSGGEAGLDWANIGSPTTTVALTGTTVDLVADAVDAAATAAGFSTELLTGLANLAVNVAQISGDSTAADNQEALLDLIVNTGNGAFPPFGISASGTAAAYTSGTPSVTLASATAAGDDNFNGQAIGVWGDEGEFMAACVDDYVGSTDVATIDAAFPTAPTGTIRYVVWATPDCGAAAGGGLDAAGVRAAVGLASANLDTQIGDLPTNAELATALGTADDAVLTAVGDVPTNAELATALGTADDAVLAAVDTVDNFLDTEITALMNARTQIFPGGVDADSVLTADSGDTNTLVDTELTFAADQDIDGAYVVRSDGQRCFIDTFTAATDTIEFGSCAFTGAWSTQSYKIYPANTQ